MFQDVIDMLVVSYYGMYEKNKQKIAESDELEDNEFDKSKDRKKMDEFIAAIVLLWQNRSGRNY